MFNHRFVNFLTHTADGDSSTNIVDASQLHTTEHTGVSEENMGGILLTTTGLAFSGLDVDGDGVITKNEWEDAENRQEVLDGEAEDGILVNPVAEEPGAGAGAGAGAGGDSLVNAAAGGPDGEGFGFP